MEIPASDDQQSVQQGCASESCEVGNTQPKHPNDEKEMLSKDRGSKACDPAEARQKLDTTLDYVLRFLEGEDVKSKKLSEHDRSKVVQEVKAAVEWGKGERTYSEITCKMFEINAMMSELLSRL